MATGNHDQNHLITSFLQEGRRHKLVITGSLEELGVKAVDVGLELAQALKGKENARHLPSMAEEALKSILDKHTQASGSFGKSIALANLGILFEPALHLDVPGLLRRYSQNNALFVEWEGDREEGRLYFLSREKGKAVSLEGVSHLNL